MTAAAQHRTDSEPTPAPPTRQRSTAYSVLVGLMSLAVLLQGLWAGIFLQGDNRDAFESWIEVHARGGEVAIALAVAAAVVGFVKLRQRADLWGGALAVAVLLVLESYVGGLIVDEGMDQLTILHVPFGMALMGLCVWLPMRAQRPVTRR